MKYYPISFLILVSIVSCGGGGSSSPPVPTVSLTSNLSEVEIGNSITLTWSSTNATSCSASGAWAGSKASSGTEEVIISNIGSNNFSLSCSDASTPGSASLSVTGYALFSGKVVDGYIRGSEVFIDKNDNFLNDAAEESVVSNNEGGFELKFSSGTLLSLGGFDLDSGNLVDGLMLSLPIDSYTETKFITPVTSLMIGMTDPTNLKSALGIDALIDIESTDPVANKGDGGVYDFLYEKGNQLTVLALALQNITNDANTSTDTSEDYFKAIAQELEAEYSESQLRVNIESQDFITKALTNIETAKALILSDENKTNTAIALSAVMPVIEVKSTDQLTQGTLNFATSTFQDDIVSIAKGDASATKIAQYQNNILNLIAADQGLEVNQLMPDITAFDDASALDEDTSVSINVLLNDSYLVSGSQPSISIGTPSNGTASVSNGVISYTPKDNYNGTDTLTYTITQNNKTASAQVTFTINPINDAPVISSNPNRSIVEGESSFALIAVDVDGDNLTFSVAGDDAASFTISDTGVLSFINATSHADPADLDGNNIYNITVTVSDGVETTASELVVTVLRFNTAPAIASLPSTIVVPENSLFVYQVKTFDLEDDAINFSISGNDADAFNISAGGLLSFKTAKDFENLSNNRFDITVTLSDYSLSFSRNITVMVKGVNENQLGEGKLGISTLE